MKKTLVTIALAVATLSAGSAFAQSQNSDLKSASASARVVAAIALTKTADLNFGDVVATAAGTVVMTPAGARSATGATLGNTSGAQAAAFGVAGVTGALYTITLPSVAVPISDGAAHTMNVTAFTGSKAGGTLTGAVSGADTFTVGATLNVGAAQVAGSYTGSFNVSVNYN